MRDLPPPGTNDPFVHLLATNGPFVPFRTCPERSVMTGVGETSDRGASAASS